MQNIGQYTWLLSRAAFDAYTTPRLNGRGFITLQSGQLATSYAYLKKAWKCGAERIKNFLLGAQEAGVLTFDVSEGFLVVTLQHNSADTSETPPPTGTPKQNTRSCSGNGGVPTAGSKSSKEEKKKKERTPYSPPQAEDGSPPSLSLVDSGREDSQSEAEIACSQAAEAWNACFADRPDMPKAEPTATRVRAVRRRMAHGWTLERWRDLLASAKAQPFALRWLHFDKLLQESVAQRISEGAYGARTGGECSGPAYRAAQIAAFLAQGEQEAIAA